MSEKSTGWIVALILVVLLVGGLVYYQQSQENSVTIELPDVDIN